MKTKLLLLTVPAMLILCTATLFGQKRTASTHPERCSIMSHTQKLIAKDPSLEQRLKDSEKIIQQWIAKHPKSANRNASAAPDTIPVVIHVVWRTAIQNVSDAQINSQMQVLNDDYARTNADTVNTPAVWKPISSGLPYYFVLARRDPNGNPTTGIVRKQTSVAQFTDDDKVKFTAQGGDDAWDSNLYLNIWVCDLGAGFFGYGEFPALPITNTRGIVCNYISFGNTGTAQAPYDGGRTITHELGHCFNLFHIWGDDFGACSGDDNCNDTPNQGSENYTPPTFPYTDNCTTTSPGVMFMNYMDYTDDVAMNMFTNDQAARMTSAISNFYPNIVNSIGIVPVAPTANDAALTATVAPDGFLCSTTIAPSVTLKNNGTAVLTSVTINYNIDGGGLPSYAWTGSLAPQATAIVSLPSATVTSGNHFFESYTSLPNGAADLFALNDTTTSSFTIATIEAIPYSESFTAATFPPSGNTVINPDGQETWKRTTLAYYSAPASMRMDNYTDNFTGEIDDYQTPSFNISGLSNPALKFYLSYELFTDPADVPNYSDTLEILASTDCGLTYTSIYKKFGAALTTTARVWFADEFIPTTAAQWRQETIDLSSFSSGSDLFFLFRNTSEYENHLYIDNINVDGLTGINENASAVSFSVYPNPAKDKIRVEASNLSSGNKSIIIYDLPGKVVYQQNLTAGSNLSQELDLSFLSTGIYTLQLNNGNEQLNKKIVLNR